MIARLFLSVRSLVFYIGYYTGTVIICIFFILLFPILPPKGRHIFAGLWCGFALGWLRLCCAVKYVVYGLENLPNKPAIILANHQSSWETILFYKLIFPVSPILKKELTRIPFWGWSMRLLKPIAIDRSKPREAGRSLLVQGVDRIQNGNSVIIFPEGSRSKYGSVKRFSRGGAKLNSICKGFEELQTVSLLDDVSNMHMIAAQPHGCAPIVEAFKKNSKEVIPVENPDTVAKSLAIGDPGDGRYVLKRLQQYNGFAEECNNKEILDAILLLARTEGIFTEPAGGVSISVLQKMVEEGKIDKNDKVVCYITGNGLKATESIMQVLPQPTVYQPNINEISAAVQ